MRACAYNVRLRAFCGCCGSLFVREYMDGVNAFYLRVSGVFLLYCWNSFLVFDFLLLVFSSLYACEYVCKCICGECVARSYMVSRALVV